MSCCSIEGNLHSLNNRISKQGDAKNTLRLKYISLDIAEPVRIGLNRNAKFSCKPIITRPSPAQSWGLLPSNYLVWFQRKHMIGGVKGSVNLDDNFDRN